MYTVHAFVVGGWRQDLLLLFMFVHACPSEILVGSTYSLIEKRGKIWKNMDKHRHI